MPAVRKPRRQHSLAHYAKTRARSRLLEKGLAIDEMDFEAIEAEIIKGIEEIPEIEMVDTEVDKIITQGLNDSRWARPIQDKDSENNSQISQNLQNKIAAGSAGQVKGLSKLTQQPNRSIPTLSTKPNTEVPSPQTAFQNTEIENTRFEEVVGKMSVPQELQEMIEAEIRRAAQAKANIQICTTAINAVEDSLSPMLTGGNKSFVDSLRVFLRASIAQFRQVGPGAAPPKLPMVPPRTLLTAAKTHEDSFPSLGPKTCAIAVTGHSLALPSQ